MNLVQFVVSLCLSFQLVNSENIHCKYDQVQIGELICLYNIINLESFIFLKNNSKVNQNYYVIKTNYIFKYPTAIKEKLQQHNITVYDKNPVDNCGWKLISRINNVFHTGDIYVKHNEDRKLTELVSNVLHDNLPIFELIEIVVLITLSIILGLFLIRWIILLIKKCYDRNQNNHTYRRLV
jgi:hypothetical protein